MKGWFLDLFRLAWAFLYWNARKSFYRMRGARNACPCQTPSDSGHAHVTGCDAVYGWNRPERFRRVCPLLERGADGRWCCGVAATEVRPFWGLAARALAVTVVCGFLVATFTLWAGLRVIGYPVRYYQVAWPPAWKEQGVVRSDFFVAKARAHYTEGRIQEAMMEMTLAYQLNPKNYAAGMMLAQFRQAANPMLADQLYGQLRASHPDKRAATTQVWLYHLLVHAEYARVVTLADEELAVAPHEAAWIHALVFACRQLHDARPLERLSVRTSALALEWRELVGIEAATLRGTLGGDDLRRRLQVLAAGATHGYVLYYALDRWINSGGGAEALAQVRMARGRLPGRTVLALGLAAYAAAGDDAGREREIAALLASRAKIGPAEIEVLCAHLIRYPQPASLRALVEAMRRDPEIPSGDQAPLYLAVYCAAALAKDDAVQLQAEKWSSMAGKTVPHVLPSLNRALRTPAESWRIPGLLPALPTMPLEVVYSLLELARPAAEIRSSRVDEPGEGKNRPIRVEYEPYPVGA